MRLLPRRTLIVLLTLLAAMSVTGRLLLLLEPGPGRLAGQSVTLHAVAQRSDPTQVLFDSAAHLDTRWQRIDVRVADPDQPPADLGSYHFVLTPGSQTQQPQIHIGQPWSDADASSDAPNWSINICVLADGEPTSAQLSDLSWLVHQLQHRLAISAGDVALSYETGAHAAADGWPQFTLSY